MFTFLSNLALIFIDDMPILLYFQLAMLIQLCIVRIYDFNLRIHHESLGEINSDLFKNPKTNFGILSLALLFNALLYVNKYSLDFKSILLLSYAIYILSLSLFYVSNHSKK